MSDLPASILVVDDDADARLLMRLALRKAGFEVRVAEGGRQALALFAEQPSQLVMLDVDMPEMDGLAVCAALRAQAGPMLPIVMVTGMEDVDSVERAYESGTTDFIAKPVNWALIGHRVRYLLRGYRALLDLRAAEARNAAILGAIPDLLFELDLDGRYHDFHAPRADLLAAPAHTLIGKTVHELLPPHAAQACMSAMHAALERGSSVGHQFELVLPQGRTWFELSVARKAVPDGEAPRFIVLSRDISERKEAEARIEHLAYFDGLTGLPNRGSFLERVDREIARARTAGQQLAVLFMDLDGFKNINDTLGHAAGDQILQAAATRLRDGLRPGDLVSRPGGDGREIQLARLGGDEFTALVTNLERPEGAVAVATRIGQLMHQPFSAGGRPVTLTTSIGIAIYPADGDDAATLLKHADTAMYHAKGQGRNNAQLYSEALTRQIVQRVELESGLRQALERGEFHLLYQPQVDVATGGVTSLEALIRWTHPERGLVAPLDFIPLAEESGLIVEIGGWVLRTACAAAARWHAAGHPVGIAVNLSPMQLGAPGLLDVVQQALDESGLPPQWLELEVTEGALLEDTTTSRRALAALRRLGVRIALDDFGTGYSSLAYLTRMPIDEIKVDRTFTSKLLSGGESEAIVRAVLAMAGSLRMRVTAEGVETVEQARALGAMGCGRLQGFYFSRPLPETEVAAMLARRWPTETRAASTPNVVDTAAIDL